MISQLKVKVTNNTSIYINAIDNEVDETKRVYAINWFNTRSLWLYNFYNFVASPFVKRVGGKVFIKAKVKKTLFGDIDDYRDMLLIVTYPTLLDFIQLVKNKFFIFVSFFRIFSVKEFTFGFTHRVDKTPSIELPTQSGSYAIHHYRTKQNIAQEIEVVANQEKGVELYYLGETVALLSIGDNINSKEETPSIIDAIAIFRTDNDENMKLFLKDKKYFKIVEKTDSSFIALVERVL